MIREYIEPNKLKRAFLSDEVYAQAIESFVIVCADVLMVDSLKKTIYLVKRRVEPMPGWWVIGGRVNAGEDFREAACRHFGVDTDGEEIFPEDLTFVAMHRYQWERRKQRPQNIGCDALAFVYLLEISTKPELAWNLCKNPQSLNSDEYDESEGYQEFTRERLVAEGVHQAIVDLYDQVFPA